MKLTKKNLKKPLGGVRIMITCPQGRVPLLSVPLRKLGASVMACPMIEIKPPSSWKMFDQALQRLETFDWILFTSVHGVQSFGMRLRALRKDAKFFVKNRIAAIGTGTRESLEKLGLNAHLVPSFYTSEALIKELQKRKQIRGKHFLLPRTDIAPEFLNKKLCSLGGHVTQVAAYRTCQPQNFNLKKFRALIRGPRPVDYVLLTSASGVRQFATWVGPVVDHFSPRLISIGPVTSAEIRALGFCVLKEARPHNRHGLIKAVLDCEAFAR